MAATTETPTREEIDEAHERLRAEHDGDDGQLFEAPSQLSFDLGTGRRDHPDFATCKIAGSLGVSEDLRYGQHVTILVVNQHGETLTEASATVGYPAFKDHFDKYGSKTVERIHTATIDAD